MKVLLVGNYPYAYQQSMQRFGQLLHRGLERAGVDVRLLRPAPVFGRMKPGEQGLGKWLGYIDRFVLFHRRLRRHVDWADVVHICDHSNAMYVPWLDGKPHIVTCHDMLAVRSALGATEEYVPRWSGRLQQRWVLAGLRKAQRIVCVSRQTAGDVLGVGGIPDERVAVIPNALNYAYRPMNPAEAAARLERMAVDARQPFFLHVGGNQWYKNRAGVLRIFGHLAAHPGMGDHRLVMVGKAFSPEMEHVVASTGIGKRVHRLVDIDNEDLRALYSTARGLIFPSLYEGFGWPVIEAQACGCPVYASNRPPLPEVGGTAARFFDPADEVGAARTVAEGSLETSKMKHEGLRNAQRHSVESMIGAYVDAYRLVLGDSIPSGAADADAGVRDGERSDTTDRLELMGESPEDACHVKG